jgi:hypothetical protein
MQEKKMQEKKIQEEKIQKIISNGAIASMVCELIGSSFKSEEFDSKYDKKVNTFTPYIFEFIAFGGITNYDTLRMKISKYTILAYQVYSIILKEKETLIVEKVIEKLELIQSDDVFKNAEGFLKLNDSLTVCLLCSLIGIRFHSDISKMIKYSLALSKKINVRLNDVMSDIGGIISAYITSLLLNKTKIDNIAGSVVEFLTSQKILEYSKSIKSFRDTWIKYYENRFRNNSPIRNEANLISHIMSIPFKRTLHYVNNYCQDEHYPGLYSLDILIISYDCLLDAESNFERFIYYCCLHNGNRSSTAMLGGLWYGLLYGTEKIPKYLIEHVDKLLPLYIENLHT